MNTALLQALGGKSKVVVFLDWETYFSADYTLKKLTTEAYVRDPRFQVLGVGVRFGDQPSVWLEEWEFREWASRVDWSRVTLVAHHAHFECLVLSHHYGIRPGFIACTMSMGRAVRGPHKGLGLDDLGAEMGVGRKEKKDALERAKGLRREQLTHARWNEIGEYCVNDVEVTRRLFFKMLPKVPVQELWIIDTTVRLFSEPRFRGDLVVLEKARAAEQKRKRDLLLRIAADIGATGSEDERVEAGRATLSSNPQFAALLLSLGIEPGKKAGKREETYAFAKTDPFMQGLVEHPDPKVRDLADARLSVKSTIVETRAGRMIEIAERGRVPFYLKYCGAHTHRWSGGDKMNPQNFNRGGDLRDAVEADDESEIAVSDSGQIEARVLPWVAGEVTLLDTFRRNDAATALYAEAFAGRVQALGNVVTKDQEKQIKRELAAQGLAEGDFYSDAGSQFFGKKLSKSDTPAERQISKALLLGLGFQMGWARCSRELLKGMLGTPPVCFGEKEATLFRVNVAAFAIRVQSTKRKKRAGGRIEEVVVTNADAVQEMINGGVRVPLTALITHCAVTDHFVRQYRRTYPRIKGAWDLMGQALAVMAPDEGPEVRMKFGPLTFIRHGIVKPNGMVLHYPGLRKTAAGFVYMGGDSGREWKHIYGGLLTENVVQSLARDIVAEQALWIRADGYPLGTTTHDEVVAVPRRGQGAECLRRMIQRMRTPPAWCADLPLNAEGGVGLRYGDAK